MARSKDTCRHCGSDPKRDCNKHGGRPCEYPKYEKALVLKSTLKRRGWTELEKERKAFLYR